MTGPITARQHRAARGDGSADSSHAAHSTHAGHASHSGHASPASHASPAGHASHSVEITRPAAAARWLISLFAATALLAGCSSIGGVAGAAAGIATGTFTSNPAIGVGVGVAVQAVTDEAMKTVFRDMQQAEQDQIASLAGSMVVGEQRPWEIRHRLPFGNEHGQLMVTRTFDTPLADCRDVLFSIDSGKGAKAHSDWFDASTCRRSDGQWKWASAEPAVERWGTLQ